MRYVLIVMRQFLLEDLASVPPVKTENAFCEEPSCSMYPRSILPIRICKTAELVYIDYFFCAAIGGA